MNSVREGQVWHDLDLRSNYAVCANGTYPIPEDYEGPLSSAPRLVQVEKVEGVYAHVKNVHNGRRAKINVSKFKQEGKRRGFVLFSETPVV